MKSRSMTYEVPWRTNYELQAFAVWCLSAFVAFTFSSSSGLPVEPFYIMSFVCCVMALGRLFQAAKLSYLQKHLKGRKLEFITFDQLKKKATPNKMWIGKGFNWENRHAQRVFEILRRDWSDIVKNTESIGTQPKMGQTWIHGVEPREKDMYRELKKGDGHTLIVGETGAGKTRTFDLFITQAILRGECVIIIDPKGDKELRDNAMRACEALGQGDRFESFHPAFPEDSIRIDLLKNAARSTEYATRIANLVPTSSSSGSDPFKAFSWQALNNIDQGLLMCHETPNLILLKRYLEGGAQGLIIKSVKAYASRVLDDGERVAQRALTAVNAPNPDKQARAMMRFYYEAIEPVAPSPELEGLLSMYQHDSTHFSKMVASLLPIMNMLTAGELGKLISPNRSDVNDTRPITDMQMIINNGQVAYFGLDSLSDPIVGSILGSLLLADLTAVAGDRYNFGVDNKVVNVFVDEASETINDPCIQLLNKGRGALLRLYIATQSFADFETRLGSKEKALQVLANINNVYCLRIADNDTQNYIVDNLPKTRLKHIQQAQSQTSNADDPFSFTGNTGQRLMEEENDLFPAQLLGMLPDLEYIAKIAGGQIIKGRLPILTGGTETND